MPEEPDLSQSYFQGHYGTKEMADAMAADIEKVACLQGDPIPRIEVTPDRDGGWNVWIWKD